jgi:hypothetical protein
MVSLQDFGCIINICKKAKFLIFSTNFSSIQVSDFFLLNKKNEFLLSEESLKKLKKSIRKYVII